MLNYYEILEINQDDPQHKVKEMFKVLAFVYHPDRCRDAPEKVRDFCNQRMKQLNEAYRVLNDEDLRNKYDATINAGPAKPRKTYAAYKPDVTRKVSRKEIKFGKQRDIGKMVGWYCLEAPVNETFTVGFARIVPEKDRMWLQASRQWIFKGEYFEAVAELLLESFDPEEYFISNRVP